MPDFNIKTSTGPAVTFNQIDTGTISQYAQVAQQYAVQAQEAIKEAFRTLQHKVESAPVKLIIRQSYKYATQAEKVFNVAACIPVLGGLFATVRKFAGMVQFTAALITVIVARTGYLIGQHLGSAQDNLDKWEQLTKAGAEHMIHGALNVIRGLGELLVSTYAFSLLLAIPNYYLMESNPSGSHFKYGYFVYPAPHEREVPPARPSTSPASSELDPSRAKAVLEKEDEMASLAAEKEMTSSLNDKTAAGSFSSPTCIVSSGNEVVSYELS